MIAIEKLDRLFEVIIREVPLTTKKLKELGFEKEEIVELVQTGVLDKKEDAYELKDADALCQYGNRKEWIANYYKANLAYKKALHMDPSCDAMYLYVLKNIKNEEPQLVYNDILLIKERNEERGLALLFLYFSAFGHISNVKTKVGPPTKASILHIKEDSKEFVEVNKAIASCLFKKALSCVSEACRKKRGEISLRQRVYKLLLRKTVERSEYINDTIISFYRQGEFQKLETFLAFQPYLDRTGEKILCMLKTRAHILSTKQSIKPKKGAQNWYRAIDYHDYETAKKLWEEFAATRVPDKTKVVAYELINELLSLTQALESRETPAKKERKKPTE